MLLRENIGGDISKYPTDVTIEIGDKLCAHFEAKNSCLESYSNVYNDDLWKSNTVEIFVDVGKENKYWEIEVAPNGTVFLAEVTRINGENTLRMIDECFVEANVQIVDNSYKVDIKIPLAKLDVTDIQKIRFNAFRIEMEGPKQYLSSLFPTFCETFHKPEAFESILKIANK